VGPSLKHERAGRGLTAVKVVKITYRGPFQGGYGGGAGPL
jgi:hypothetical protein